MKMLPPKHEIQIERPNALIFPEQFGIVRYFAKHPYHLSLLTVVLTVFLYTSAFSAVRCCLMRNLSVTQFLILWVGFFPFTSVGILLGAVVALSVDAFLDKFGNVPGVVRFPLSLLGAAETCFWQYGEAWFFHAMPLLSFAILMLPPLLGATIALLSVLLSTRIALLEKHLSNQPLQIIEQSSSVE